MALHWLNILPMDRYIVRTNSNISETDRMIVTLLYQPLIGAVAHSLYFALFSELERDQYISEETTHKSMMTMMGLPLDIIYEERKKLEGIGLLEVYKKKNNDDVVYLYELQKPFSPADFFQDDVLSVYLYNRVGKARYLKLRERFTINKIDRDEFQKSTAAFSDVFTSLHHSEICLQKGELSSALVIPAGTEISASTEHHSYKLDDEHFDFSLLATYLANYFDTSQLLNDQVKQTISKLAFIYRIDPFEMSKIVQDCLLQDDTIDLHLLRDKVKRWYRFSYENEPPALGLKVHPKKFRMIDEHKENLTEEEKVILHFETISPIALLENKSKGAKVAPGDAQIIESLIFDYKLLPGVVNVLIEYVLDINDMKLTKAFVEKIAAQWARKNIKTVKDAMELAKQEYRNRNEWQKGKGETPQGKNKKTNHHVKRDRLPKWLLDEKEANVPLTNDQLDISKIKEELEHKLSRLKGQKNG